MTILFMGGDLSSMTETGFAGDLTSVGFYGTVPFTELGVRTTGGASEYVTTPTWSAVQELWLHVVARNSAGSEKIYFMDGTDASLKLYRDGSSNYSLWYLSAPATYTQIGSSFTLSDEWHYLDIYLKTGASGAVALYFNGIERLPETAASITQAPDIDSIRFTGDQGSDWGGMVVADEPTIGWRLGRLQPTANGANTAYTGDIGNVDEVTNNDADYIYSNTANQVETYTVTTVPASTTGYVPRAVAVSARAKRGGSGPQNLQLCLRSGGTDYFSGTKALGLGYTGQEHVWETNPDTGLAWTTSQLAALQIGVKSIA